MTQRRHTWWTVMMKVGVDEWKRVAQNEQYSRSGREKGESVR
jgi:hypothetical protein